MRDKTLILKNVIDLGENAFYSLMPFTHFYLSFTSYFQMFCIFLKKTL